jgi:hypothetical protein
MSEAPNFYAKVRAEVLGLLGWKSDESLSPDAVMRVDLCVSLRLAIDDMNGRLARGEPVDVSKLLSCADALSRFLPARAPPPPAYGENDANDPRKLLFDQYMAMRARGGISDEGKCVDEIAALKAEVERLTAELAGKSEHSVERVPAPLGANVVPLKANHGQHLQRPNPPAAPAAPAADDAIDIRGGFDDRPEPWRDFSTDVEGNPLTARGRKYWGPV